MSVLSCDGPQLSQRVQEELCAGHGAIGTLVPQPCGVAHAVTADLLGPVEHLIAMRKARVRQLVRAGAVQDSDQPSALACAPRMCEPGGLTARHELSAEHMQMTLARLLRLPVDQEVEPRLEHESLSGSAVCGERERVYHVRGTGGARHVAATCT